MAQQVGTFLLIFIGVLFVCLITLPYFFNNVKPHADLLNDNSLHDAHHRQKNDNHARNLPRQHQHAETQHQHGVSQHQHGGSEHQHIVKKDNTANEPVKETLKMDIRKRRVSIYDKDANLNTEDRNSFKRNDGTQMTVEEIEAAVAQLDEIETLDHIDTETDVAEPEDDNVEEGDETNEEKVVDDSIPYYTPQEVGNYEEKNVLSRSGPGENGDPYDVSKLDSARVAATISEYGYNVEASDKIPLDRRIKDFRSSECMHWNYPTKLPKASVIITFYNEGLSALLRTVYSVINTSPAELLEEIVLVDDSSTQDEYKEGLKTYLSQFGGKVKFIRTTKNEGLIKARSIGIDHAIGEVIVILDAHCECEENWLPPLLSQIAINRHTLACPMIDKIDWNTFEHKSVKSGVNYAGAFEWGLLYKNIPVPKYQDRTREFESEPFLSPTHAGGLFAMDRKWFLELGGYDLGIKFWGSEQFYLSFKIWQCGGQIEVVPCSRIGHVYKAHKGRPRNPSVHYQSSLNQMRVAEVWMDGHKEFFYTREPQIRYLDYGDITEQLELRQRLNCKSFDWYMKHIAFDILKYFPYPPPNKAWGQCSNPQTNTCLDTLGSSPGGAIGVYACHNELGNQLFRLNMEGELARGEYCIKSDGDTLKIYNCIVKDAWDPVGEWYYDSGMRTMKSKMYNKCLTTNGGSLWLAPCEDNNQSQIWEWKETYVKP